MLFRLFTSPARALGFVFRSIHEATVAEVDQQREDIRHALHELYEMVESGEIDEDTFEQREDNLLDRLDEIDEMEALDSGSVEAGS